MNSIGSDFILNCFNKDYNRSNNFDNSINRYLNQTKTQEPIVDTPKEVVEQSKPENKQESFSFYNFDEDKNIVIKFSIKNIIIVILSVLLLFCYYHMTKYKNKLKKYKHPFREFSYNLS